MNKHSYYITPLAQSDKIFLPKVGSLFYYKKDLKLIIKHSYTENKFDENPTFMIILEDEYEIDEILHPFDNTVIII